MLRGVMLLVASAWLVADAGDEHARVLEAGRRKALEFSQSLPDFICSEAIRRLEGPLGREPSRQTDLLMVQLSYSGREENYELLSVNDRVAHEGYHGLKGAATTGEFGSWLRSIFDPASGAEFRWERRETVRERDTDVYGYKVERAKSKYDLNYRESAAQFETATVGYHGAVYIDLASTQVVRVLIEADAIPRNFPLKHSSILLDYDFAGVGGREYLLPFYAESRLGTAKLEFRNQMTFWEYRKFDATAAIGFGAAPEKAAPEKAVGALKSTRGALFSAIELGGLHDEQWILPPPAKPSEEERRKALIEARGEAARYAASLPAFVCTDVFRHYTSPPEAESWELRGTLTFKLTHFAKGQDSAPVREDYALIVQDKGDRRRAQELGGALQASAWDEEFRKFASNVLDLRSAAAYRWDHWTMLRGRVTHVYLFAIGAADSRYFVDSRYVANSKNDRQTATPYAGQRGLVYVDAKSHRVVRICAEADASAPDSTIVNQAVLLDFDFDDLAGARTLLPLRTATRIDTKSLATRYESEFSYAKPAQ